MELDPTKVIERLGGPGRVAELLAKETGVHVGRTAVANWRLEGRQIPWRWRETIKKLLGRKAA